MVGQYIYFIQHPAGRPKEIGYWEDEAHSIRCAVAAEMSAICADASALLSCVAN